MPHTPETWPIGAALLNFTGTTADGRDRTTAGPEAWRQTLREVRLAGFDHVDLTDSWVRPADLDTDGRRRLLETARSYDLAFSDIAVTRKSVITPDEDRARENMAYTKRTIDAAADLEVPMVCLGLHDPFTEPQKQATWFWLAEGAEDEETPENREKAAARFRELGEYAAERGVSVSLEMYEGTFLGTADSSVQLVTAVDLTNVGLCPDIGNIVRLHREVEDWREMLTKMLPHTNYWQLKNYFRDHDPATGSYASAPAPLALGFIDYREAIGMALEAGFDGPMCVEHYGGDGLTVTAMNRDYIRGILAAKLPEA
ncbi:sugar phosphate isomerase/epimerase [Kocuria rosea]|uniref:sugar phosphate isomerase/epimerase family protein n=1 Tax=Kocuria TaxID=57493 RepID=UPI0003631A72|nr:MULTISPECIES: sugar phosphate isomerase/epimerase family protein [Kocuria]EYT51419.1 xylose isomerase [Kocuria sp. UCD-OTCP]MEB2527324.1 sugar phosphate isomerase/epimerase family protein [Kocuria rosea]MEB2617628.1 sugar phosphate isomerase/epimerase family protein [Kocuria rosea]PWF87326.1 sugar phosphate isomerase/epimerase [Kocuria rosea]QCY34326.1 sugar phosphate isomerase/epimerase [Kocuria rosea]